MAGSNTLSFTITAKNNASPALNSLKNQVNSLKSGIESLGSSTASLSRSTSTLSTTTRSGVSSIKNLTSSLSSAARTTTSLFKGMGNIALAPIKAIGSGISGLVSGVTNFGKSITSTIGLFGGFKIAEAAIDAVSSSFDRAIQRADTMDLFEQKMTMITGSAENASSALEQLKVSTKGTPYALDIAAKSVQNFVTRGMETQKAVDSVNIWMDAVSAYGNGSNEQFESVLDAIAKMRTKGTVEMRYLNRLFAAGINPVQMYAKATGMAAEDVQTALSEKEIGTEEFLNVVETAMREGTNGVIKVEGMAKQLATTWVATIANMRAAIARGLVEFLDGLNSVALLFNENGLKGIVSDFGKTVENVLTGVGKRITSTVNKAKALTDQLRANNQGVFDQAQSTISAGREQRTTSYGNAKGNFLGEIVKVQEQFDKFYVKLQNLKVAWDNVWTSFARGIETVSGPFGRFIASYLGVAIDKSLDLGTVMANWINPKITTFFNALGRVFNTLANHADGFGKALDFVGKEFKFWSGLVVPPSLKLIQMIFRWFKSNSGDIGAGINNIYQGFKEWASLAVPEFFGLLTHVFEWFMVNQDAIVTGLKNIFNEIRNAASIVVPAVFHILQNVLLWMIDNSEVVVASVKAMIAAFLGFKALQGIQATILGLNDAIKTLNNTLGFFTGGKIQLPTLESINENRQSKIAQELERENELRRERNRLDEIFNQGRERIKSAGLKDLNGIDKNQLKEEQALVKQYSKEKNSISTGLDKDLGRLDLDRLKATNRIDTDYNKGIEKIELQKQREAERIARSELLANRQGSQQALSAELANLGLDSSVYGLTDYKNQKTFSPKALEEQIKLQDELYEKMKQSGSTGGASAYLSDIYNSRLSAEMARDELEKSIQQRRYDNDTNYNVKRQSLYDAASSKYNELRYNTVEKRRNIKDNYNQQRSAVRKSTMSNLDDLAETYLEGKNYKAPKKQTATGKVLDWMKSGTRNLFDYTGNKAKSGIDWTKERLKNLNRGPSGEKIFSKDDFLDTAKTPFRLAGKGAKSVGNAGKNIAGGAMDFFKTMFGGFTDLKNQDMGLDLSVLDSGAQKTGIFAKSIEGLKTAFTGIGDKVAAFSEPLSGAIQGFMSFVSSIAGGIATIVLVTAAIGALVAGLGALNPGNKVSDGINQFFDGFRERCISFADNAGVMIQNFVDGLIQNLPMLITQGVNLLLSLVRGILVGIPAMIEAGAKILFSLISGLLEVLPELVKAGFQAIGKFVGGIFRSLPEIGRAAWQMIGTLVKGIVNLLPKIIVCGVKLIWALIEGITSMIIEIGKGLVDAIVGGITYLWEHGGEIWDNLKQFGIDLWNGFLEGFGIGGGSEKVEAPVENTVQKAQDKVDDSSIDWGSLFDYGGETAVAADQSGSELGEWVKGGFSESMSALPGQAYEQGTLTAQGWDTGLAADTGIETDLTAEQREQMAALGIDAGQYGTDTAANYMQGLSPEEMADLGITSDVANQMANTSEMANSYGTDTMNNFAGGISAGGAQVDSAVAGVGTNGINQLNTTFNEADVATASVNFIQRVKEAIFTNSILIENTMRDVATRGINAFINQFNQIDEESIKITNFTTLLRNSFNDANISVSTSMQEMKTNVIEDFNELRTNTESALSLIRQDLQTFVSTDMYNFESGIKTKLDQIYQDYTYLETQIHNILDSLGRYHETKGTEMMNNLKSGIEQNMGGVLDTANFFVDQLNNVWSRLNTTPTITPTITPTVVPTGEVYGPPSPFGSFAVGTRFVPQDMLAMIHEGEAIIPASQNPYTNSGGDYLNDLVSSMETGGLQGLSLNAFPTDNSTSNENNNNFNIVFNNSISSDADADRFTGNLESELHRILQNGMRTSTPR